MKVLILSDTHGYLDPAVAEVAGRCDLAVHAGDIMGAGVLDALGRRTRRVVAVRGNNDVPAKWALDEHPVLQRLDDTAIIDLPGGILAVVHGHRIWDCRDRHDRMRRQFPQARAIVYGHSHIRVCDLDTRPWVLNPGAAGRVRTHGGPTCLVLHANADSWHVDTLRFELEPARRRA